MRLFVKELCRFCPNGPERHLGSAATIGVKSEATCSLDSTENTASVALPLDIKTAIRLEACVRQVSACVRLCPPAIRLQICVSAQPVRRNPK